MENEKDMPAVIKLQRYLLVIVIIFLAGGIVTDYINEKAGLILNYLSIGILIIAAPIRMISVSRYFRETNDRKHEILAYAVIGIIVVAAIVKAFV